MTTPLELEIARLVKEAIDRRTRPPDPAAEAHADVRRKVCLHEASHAVAIWATSAPPLRRCVVHDDGSGFTANGGPAANGDDPPDRHALLEAVHRKYPEVVRGVLGRQIVGVAAGLVADSRTGLHGSDNDEREITSLSTIAVPDRVERDAWVAELRQIAEELVGDFWEPTISEFARWLDRDRDLDDAAMLVGWLDHCGADAQRLKRVYTKALATPTVEAPARRRALRTIHARHPHPLRGRRRPRLR